MPSIRKRYVYDVLDDTGSVSKTFNSEKDAKDYIKDWMNQIEIFLKNRS